MKKQANNPMKAVSAVLTAAVLSLTFLEALPIEAVKAQSPLTEEEAYAIGVKAYLYFYPLVTMDITRKQLTNTELGKGIGGPMNTFANISEYPTADMKVVVRPNFDTLYSSAWL